MCRIVLGIALLASTLWGQSWNLQYFHDHETERLYITDLKFPSERRGVAVGIVVDERRARVEKRLALVSNDSGENWNEVELREDPVSLFFLDDSLGWMVTERGIWRTLESGLSWRKISDQDRDRIRRVWFLDEQHGFAVGREKTALETFDGGEHWVPIEAASEPTGNPDFSSYNHIAFADRQHGLIVGSAVPPRSINVPGPEWLFPEVALADRQGPTLTLELQTLDAAKTWTPSTAPLFGVVNSIRVAETDGLIVFRYDPSFEWPSEVYHLDLTTGRSESVFREENRLVTDVALFPPDPDSRQDSQDTESIDTDTTPTPAFAFLAAIEPPGEVATLPTPGRVKMLASSDLVEWVEMEVDYRAIGSNVILAGPDAGHLWMATDTGMILRLEP